MKLSKTKLKNLILEVLSEQEDVKLKTASMSGAAFGRAGKEGRQAADPELTSLEKGIIQQIDQFLLKLASTPGVDINSQKSTIQRVMKILQDQVGKMAKEQPQQDQQQGVQK